MNNFLDVYRAISRELEDTDFCVLGTFNLFLQGIKVIPNDLDFIADEDDIHRVGVIFGSPVKRNYQGYEETEFELDGVNVHFVGAQGNKIRPPFRENTTWVEEDGLRIPCLSLAAEEKFYIYKNREKDTGKVELIRERMRG